jgi:PAS domain S-box-containing protein
MADAFACDEVSILDTELAAMSDLLTVQEKVVSEQSAKLDEYARQLRQAYDTLQESEKRYRDILGSINDAVWEVDASGIITYVNPSPLITALLGYSSEELIGKSIWALFAPEDAAQAKELLGISTTISLLECNMRRKDGTEFVGQSNCVGVLDDSGTLIGYRCVTRDITERKQAEDALEQSERRYREILESMSDVVWEIDTNHIITYVNQRAEEVLGYTPAELIGMSTRDLALPEDADRSALLLEAHHKVDLLDVRCRRKDGSMLSLQISLRPTLNDSGSIIGYKCVARDITKQKKAEEALKASEANYRKIFNSVQEGIIIYDIEARRIIDANSAATEVLNYTQDELKSMGLELFDSGERPYTKGEALRRMMQAIEDSPQRFEWKCRSKSGEVIWIDVCLQRAILGGRNVMLGVNQNITERKQTEAVLKASEANYRTIFNSVNECIFIHDLETGRILGVNQPTLEMLGYTTEEMKGLSIGDISLGISPYTQEDARRWVAKAGMEGPQRFEWKLRNKSGRVFWAEVNLKRAVFDGKDVVLAVVHDITERKEAEEALAKYADELADSNADLQQFAYAASHDLQEPLRAVASYAQLLERRYKGKLDPEADEFITFMTDGANRMREMISSLLEFSRVGTHGKSFQPVDVELVLQQALMNLMVAIDESRAKITHDPLPMMRADANQLTQLFQNLIGNAIKFRADEPPKIHVSAKRADGFWTFSVSDNGIGFAHENIGRLFQVFARLDNGRSRPGTGMGLAICKRIAERHNGYIWAESEPGKGSTFLFKIPDNIEVGDEHDK